MNIFIFILWLILLKMKRDLQTLYERLLNRTCSAAESLQFLQNEIDSHIKQENIKKIDDIDKIENLKLLYDFLCERHEKVLKDYTIYLEKRKISGKPLYFKGKLHSQWYLSKIAPTKLVDGVWLENIDNIDETNINFVTKELLKKIWNEETGNGGKNSKLDHVTVYKKLMKTVFPSVDWTLFDNWRRFHLLRDDDECYRTGCIQMALAANSQYFLPEIIGYTLGYEQLPLHMLITIKELEDFSIDPYYFTLHVSTDNFENGHAKVAYDVACSFIKNRKDDEKIILQRILTGYKLSQEKEDFVDFLSKCNIEEISENILSRKCKMSHSIHDNVLVEDNGTWKSLGILMRTWVNGENKVVNGTKFPILHMLKTNRYLDETLFSETKFAKLLEFGNEMFSTFEDDEIIFIMDVHQGTIEVCPNELLKNKNDTFKNDILKILNSALKSHKFIFLKHPDTGVSLTIKEWMENDPDMLYETLCDAEVKQRIRKSFSFGKMKNVNINENDMKIVNDWLELIY